MSPMEESRNTNRPGKVKREGERQTDGIVMKLYARDENLPGIPGG
jgi:hypothetical protein